MAKRSKARQRALEILFEAEQRSMDPQLVLNTRVEKAELIVNDYVRTLIQGVAEHRDEIDELLATYARGWTLERMPPVDLMALRIGAWELLHNEEIPDSVAVSEAVTLVRKLSTDESPGFVNGVLGRLQKLKPTLG
ncbi:transcription antitermination factor NusB [Nesterenkonia natronophila]|uniref:Transcription antitermination protein NusB n=1 Tax=Nesterenkonia natronophila TaxID=2174932 RepID=A0A3A4EZY7_9MICC|nr:transcription antitermination factor NusB [Nesterenkonia natronophila]RJN31138.1 transcription antitermination factor NusB [Nesterenkonia natronophila]